MCTVTVRLASGPLLVTMNRDERVDRAPERPPVVHEAFDGRQAWVAPVDGQAGGTWIGAGAAGIASCLLNAYDPGDPLHPPPPGAPSRGRIVPEIVSRDVAAARRWLSDTFDPSPYPSFLLVIAWTSRAESLRWRPGAGSLERTPLTPGWSLVTSSGWNPAEVVPWRRERFDAWIRDGAPMADGLPSFHTLEVPGLEGWSPWLTRTWSATRSVTQVAFDAAAGRATMRYWRRPAFGPLRSPRPDAVEVLPVGVGRA